MYYSKAKIVLFFCFLLLNSCDLQRNLNTNLVLSNENKTELPQYSNANSIPSSNLNLNNSNTDKEILEEIKSRYQTKPRRKQINFPFDCAFGYISSDDKNWKEKTACAKALESITTDLQTIAKENNCSKPMSAENLNRYEVIDGDKISTYKIKNSTETDIAYIEKKLNTVIKNIATNSNLEYPIKLKAGQVIKYQKAHYEYNFNPVFYSFSINKYLVELPCWTAAYNLSNVYLLYDESELPAKITVLDFPNLSFTFDENKDEPKNIENVNVKTVGGRWFNPKTKELIVFVKGRGIGDFGQYARYSFLKDKPTLKEFKAKFIEGGKGYEIDEILKQSPKNWKQFYPK